MFGIGNTNKKFSHNFEKKNIHGICQYTRVKNWIKNPKFAAIKKVSARVMLP